MTKLKSSNLVSFKSFFQKGLSIQEGKIIHEMKLMITNCFQILTSTLMDSPETLYQYTDLNNISKTYDFNPSKFIRSIKEEMSSQLRFHEFFSHTQIFVQYLETVQKNLELREEMLNSDSARFIAIWLSFRWSLYRNRKRREMNS